VKPQTGQSVAQQRIGPSGSAALRLLACCPHIPTDVVAVLLRMRHARSAAQLLLRLKTARLAQYKTLRPGPFVGSSDVRLWMLTPAGRTIVAARGLEPPAEPRTRLPYGQPARWHDVARQRPIPMLIVAYRLLARVVRALDQPVRVAAWEHPWIRTVGETGTGRARHVRVPAAAALIPNRTDCQQPRPVLLMPDLGTIPVASYRTVLRGLIELAHTSGADEDEPLLVVGVAGAAASSARLSAWHSLLEQVARRVGEQPLRAQVLEWPERLVSFENTKLHFGDSIDQVFGLVARHPLLTRQQLAILLGTSEAYASRLVVQLIGLGWMRTMRCDQVDSHTPRRLPGQQRPVALTELTPAGRREAARRLLLPVGLATRYHGLLRSQATTRQIFRHLAHTLGANAVFVAFVSSARQMTKRGGDDALEEWRSAAACARGRFRPDGYGCYRRDGSRFGFFLEFDRGTERAREYAAKLAAYYRYCNSNEATRQYNGIPTLLVVTTLAAAEARFTYHAHLAQQRHGAAPLSIFLTTTSRIRAHADGVLGPIWRSTVAPWAAEPARGWWLPTGRPTRP
jgi:hypothetical protein